MVHGKDEAALFGVGLGRAIAEARAATKRSMRSVAADAGISQPFLSQIEGGQALPSLLTLYRLAGALNISPSELLRTDADRESIRVVRRGEGHRVRVSEAANTAMSRVIAARAGRSTVVEYRIKPGEDMGDWFESDGELLVYVAAGQITVNLEDRGDHTLTTGDALSQPGAIRNHWTVDGPGEATVLLVHLASERLSTQL